MTWTQHNNLSRQHKFHVVEKNGKESSNRRTKHISIWQHFWTCDITGDYPGKTLQVEKTQGSHRGTQTHPNLIHVPRLGNWSMLEHNLQSEFAQDQTSRPTKATKNNVWMSDFSLCLRTNCRVNHWCTKSEVFNCVAVFAYSLELIACNFHKLISNALASFNTHLHRF